MEAGSTARTLVYASPPTAGPAGWLALPGPGTGLIRPAGSSDCDGIRAFISGLSSRALYLRFFASVSPPSTALLRTLCGITGAADILVATDSRGTIIGHAMAADIRPAASALPAAPGPLETSIGLVIADDWQRHGLGTTLLDLLVSRAVQRGVSRLVLDVLPDNAAMREIIGRRWPDAPLERTRDALIFRPPIGPGDARPPVELPAVIGLRRDRAGLMATTHPGGNRVPGRSAA
jgi:GNAT superfamily N-acetyltransferase